MCASWAHHRAQHVRTAIDQRAQRVLATVRNMCALLPAGGRKACRDVRAGCAHDPPIPASICAWRAPGSDQFYEEIGTSIVGGFCLLIWSTTGIPIPSPVCTRKLDEDFTDGISSPERSERYFRRQRRRRRQAASEAGGRRRRRWQRRGYERKNKLRSFWCVSNEYPRASIYRFSMGLNQLNGLQVHHCGSIIIPIDDQIGPFYIVYKTEHYDVKTIFRTTCWSAIISPVRCQRGSTHLEVARDLLALVCEVSRSHVGQHVRVDV
ncbi:hypothetical protein F511_19468 [Dorcoceras hygrometricum]|uniref:Uncharacterized protein n=1 Tax=Dorcoceras hygrometricum TaxID=472368 RepID=A0A2Z7DF59_9LAMI|nr:hypothetical protein F511_19468 [Dorcoceras hygrometricum]